MKKSLLDVIFASVKRKEVLLILQDGAKDMEYLLKSLDTTRKSLLPQIKVLEEHYLVSHDKETYELTAIGKLIVQGMMPLMDTITVFDSDIDYWGTHKLDFIPPAILKRINELEECTVISPSFTEMHCLHKKLHEETLKSKSLYGVIRIFSSDYKQIISQLMDNNIDLYVIISKDLFHKLLTDDYADFSHFVGKESLHFFVYSEEMRFIELIYNDYYVFMRLLPTADIFDSKFVVVSNPTAVNWAKDIFQYYLNNSTPITKV